MQRLGMLAWAGVRRRENPSLCRSGDLLLNDSSRQAVRSWYGGVYFTHANHMLKVYIYTQYNRLTR